MNPTLILTGIMAAHTALAAPTPDLNKFTPPMEQTAQQFYDSGWLDLNDLGEPKMTEKLVSPDHITNVGKAQIRFFLPKEWTGADKRSALLIFPGGGYSIQSIEKEGINIALWATQRDMVGVVVKYRVSSVENETGKFPGPLLDARKAMRLTRHSAEKLGIDPKKIGVIGFSAGAHLAGMTATLWDEALPQEEKDPLKNVPARPDFAMLIYPVASMEKGVTHGGTRFKILGANPTQEEADRCSVEKQVTKDTPPVFLVHAKDDGVSCKNSLLMEQACKDKGVPVELHLYEKGGHGYGMEQRGTPTDAWPTAAEQWLKKRGL